MFNYRTSRRLGQVTVMRFTPLELKMNDVSVRKWHRNSRENTRDASQLYIYIYNTISSLFPVISTLSLVAFCFYEHDDSQTVSYPDVHDTRLRLLSNLAARMQKTNSAPSWFLRISKCAYTTTTRTAPQVEEEEGGGGGGA